MKFNKQKLIIILVTLTVISLIIGVFIILNNPLRTYEKNLKFITKNTKLIDSNIDHNQALDVLEYSQKKGIKTPDILINFDTHSDVYLNRKVIGKYDAGIEDWINEFISKNPNVNNVIWVISKEEALNTEMRKEFAANKKEGLTWGLPLFGNSLKDDIFYLDVIPLNVFPYTQTFLLDEKTGILNEYVEDHELNNLLFEKETKFRKITITTCTENTLPDLNGKDVFLSIDADYLSNSGFDTFNEFKTLRTPKELDYAIASLVKSIKTKHINPVVISMTLSPQYLPQKAHMQVIDFFKFVHKTSGLEDEISTYKRHFTKLNGGKGTSPHRRGKDL